MNDSTRKIIAAIGSSVKPTGFGESSWIAKCPSHDDQKASLSITDGDDGRCVVYCHAGCATEEIMKTLGLQMSDLFPVKQNVQEREISATYDYKDENGALLYQVIRYFPKDFRQRRPDGQGGWIWNLQGIPNRVLYRTESIALTDKEETIFLVEGERDVHTIERIGLRATTGVGGAGKWRAEYSETLRGRPVIIIPDNDAPGKEHAKLVSDSLQGIAKSILILELPGLPPKGDISDWIQSGHTLHDLMLEILKAEASTHPGVRFIDLNVEPEPIQWLVDGWISKRDIVLLAGRPGGGKSTTAADIAIAIAGGRNGDGWMGNKLSHCPVLYLDEEAGETEIKRQFIRQGGLGLNNLHISSCQHLSLSDPESISRINHEIVTHQPGLIVLDTASHFFSGADENNANDIAALFVPLFDWRDRYGTSFIIIHHMRKASQQGYDDLMERIRGTTAFTAQASTVWTAVPHANSPHIEIQVHKRRGGGKGKTLRIGYFQDGDNIRLEEIVSDPGFPIDSFSRDVANLFPPDAEHTRSEIIKILPNLTQKQIDHSLEHLIEIGLIERPSRGRYRLKKPSFPGDFAGIGGNSAGNAWESRET